MSKALPLPPSLVARVTSFAGDEGAAWLASLPTILSYLSQRWSLEIGPPFPDLSINYVAPARRANGQAAVLKVGFLPDEQRTERDALRLAAGRGMVQLLEADERYGALLLERLAPGAPLADIEQEMEPLADDLATRTAAAVMRRLSQAPPPGHSFPSVHGWLAHMDQQRAAVLALEPHFPMLWVDRALAVARELEAERRDEIVLHGDLHYGNILSAQREPWLAIDPKGVVGDPGAEIGPLLFNALPRDVRAPATRRTLMRRLDILAEALEMDRQWLAAWSLIRLVLSAFWTVEDHGQNWQRDIVLAGLLSATP